MTEAQIPAEWVLYGGLVTFIITVIYTANPKLLDIFGKWGVAAQERMDRQRSAAKAADDFDIAERDRQIAYQAGRLDEMNAELARRDQLIREHAPWDWARFEEQIRQGYEVPPPPPLIPHVSPPSPAPREDSDDRVP